MKHQNKSQSFERSLHRLIWFHCSWILVLVQYQTPVLTEPVDIDQSATVILQCKRNMEIAITDIQAIGWDLDGDIIAELQPNSQTPLEVKNPEFYGRINFILPSGDLRLSDTAIKDQGKYQCFVISNGVSSNAEEYDLTVLVPPEFVTVLCSERVDGVPKTTCTDIADDKIKTISCSVSSKPRSEIQWLRENTPDNCEDEITQSSCQKDDSLDKCLSIKRQVCGGEYKCIVTYPKRADSIASLPVTVSNAEMPSPGNNGEETDSGGVAIYIVVAVVIVIILVFAGVIVVIMYLRHRNKNADKPSNNYKKPADSKPDNPPPSSPELGSSPYEGDMVHIESKMSTNERKDEEHEKNAKFDRQPSLDADEEEDKFLSLNEKNVGPPASDKRKAFKTRSIVPAYPINKNPKQVSMQTKQFFEAASRLPPNTRMRYEKKEEDGTERVFEIETKDSNALTYSQEPHLQVQADTIPVVQEVSTDDEQSMISKQ